MVRRKGSSSQKESNMNRRPSAFDPFSVLKEDKQQQVVLPNNNNYNNNNTEFTFPPSEPSSNNSPSFRKDDFGWPQDPAWTAAITGTSPNNILSFQATNPATTPATTPTRNKQQQLLDITATTTSTNTSLDSSSLNYSSQDSSNNNSNNIPGDSQIQAALTNAFQNSSNNNNNNDGMRLQQQQQQQQQQQYDFNVFPDNDEVVTNNANADALISSKQKIHHQSPQLQARLKRSTAATATTTTTTTSTSPQTTTTKSVSPSQTATTLFEMKVEERLSIYLDDTTSAPTCRVIGTISIKTSSSSTSFCLIIRDRKSTIERWEEQQDICKNITSSITAANFLDSNDQVFRISSSGNNGSNITQQQHHHHQQRLSMNGGEGSNIVVPILAYRCHSNLKPIPVLVKTKVISKEDRCRVGIRFRANPSNGYQLHDVAIVMVVPPDIDGEGVSISRKGGVWDVMKRTLSWIIPELSAGEVIDIQAQFKCQPTQPQQQQQPPTPNFPILVQCNGNTNFSKIQLEAQQLSAEGSSRDSIPVELNIEKIANVLYRKV